MTRWSTLLPSLGLAASLFTIAGMVRHQSRLRAVRASNATTIDAQRHALTAQHGRVLAFETTWGTDSDWSFSTMYLPTHRVDSKRPPPLFRVAAENRVRFPVPSWMESWRRGPVGAPQQSQ